MIRPGRVLRWGCVDHTISIRPFDETLKKSRPRSVDSTRLSVIARLAGLQETHCSYPSREPDITGDQSPNWTDNNSNMQRGLEPWTLSEQAFSILELLGYRSKNTPSINSRLCFSVLPFPYFPVATPREAIPENYGCSSPTDFGKSRCSHSPVNSECRQKPR